MYTLYKKSGTKSKCHHYHQSWKVHHVMVLCQVTVCWNSKNQQMQSCFVKVCVWNWLIFRPHRSTTYVDATCCYRSSSVVCQSVSQSVTVVCPAKMRCRLGCGSGGPRNHALDGVPDPHWKGQFWEEKRRPVVKYRDTLRWAVQKRLNRSRCRLGCGLGLAQGIVLDGGPDPYGNGQFWGGKRRPVVKYRDTPRFSAQKNGWTDPDAIWVMGSDGL